MKDILFLVGLYTPNDNLNSLLSLSKNTREYFGNEFWFEKYKKNSKKRIHKGDVKFECVVDFLYEHICKYEFTIVVNPYYKSILSSICYYEFGTRRDWNKDTFVHFYNKWKNGVEFLDKINKAFSKLPCNNKEHYHSCIVYNDKTDYFQLCKKRVINRRYYPVNQDTSILKNRIDFHKQFEIPEAEQRVKQLSKQLKTKEDKMNNYQFYVNEIVPQKQQRIFEKIKQKEEKDLKKTRLSFVEYEKLIVEEINLNDQQSFKVHTISKGVNKKSGRIGHYDFVKKYTLDTINDFIGKGYLVRDNDNRIFRTSLWNKL